MTFETDLQTFLDNICADVDGSPDPAFMDLIKRHASAIFLPKYQPQVITVNITNKQRKKSPSGYNLFMEEYAKNNPGIKHILKVTSDAWNALNDADKQAYLDRSAAMKKRNKELAEATDNIPVVPKDKRSANGYQLFVAENHVKGDGLTMQEVADKWHNLGEAGQLAYKDKAKELKVKAEEVTETKATEQVEEKIEEKAPLVLPAPKRINPKPRVTVV